MMRDRVLVAVGPDSRAEQVLRAGKRIADRLDASWAVAYVETTDWVGWSASARNGRDELMRAVESLGTEAVVLEGPSAAQALQEYARTLHATHIVIGAPLRRGFWGWLRRSTAAQLVRKANGFDVITIGAAADADSAAATLAAPEDAEPAAGIDWQPYLWALAVSALTTGVAFAMYPFFSLSNILMAYMVSSTVVAMKFGRGPTVAASIANVLAFDIYFVPPRFAFSAADLQYLVTFLAMLIVAGTTATLMASVRKQTRVAGARQRRAELLYAMSRELTATRGVANMARVAVRHIEQVFDCKVVVLLPNAEGELRHPAEPPTVSSFKSADLSIAQWVMGRARRAGLGSEAYRDAPALYLPLTDEHQQLGVLAVLPNNPRRIVLPEQRQLLEAFAGQLALSIERAQLAAAAEAGHVAAQTESLRSTLLASISHDLRTPLAAIAGAGSALADRGRDLDEDTRASLARSIATKAQEMSEIVSNVLDLMRFESGQIVLRRDWHALDDLIGTALVRTEDRLRERPVRIDLPDDLPALCVDGSLIVQVLVNALDNAAKHTPGGTLVHISAQRGQDGVVVCIDDEGPGFPMTERERLFEKFQRGTGEGAVVGAGLGLAICRAVIRAHGGEIHAADRPGGGARLQFSLLAESRQGGSNHAPSLGD